MNAQLNTNRTWHINGHVLISSISTRKSSPLEEWSARRRDLYLTTHNTHKRHVSVLPLKFEPEIPASEWPQTHALDRAATGTGDTTHIDCVWNVLTHAQKTDFVFRRNGRVHLNRRWPQFSRLLAAEVCASAVVMMDTPCSEVVWRVLATHSIRQFLLHFPSRASPCASHFNWTLPSKYNPPLKPVFLPQATQAVVMNLLVT